MRNQKKRYNSKRVHLGQRPHEPKYWCLLHRRSLSEKQTKLKHCHEKNCQHLKEYRPVFQPLYSDQVDEWLKQQHPEIIQESETAETQETEQETPDAQETDQEST